MIVEIPQLVAATESLVALADEFIAFADDIIEEQEQLLDPDLLRRDPRAYLRMLNEWSQGIGLPNGWVPAAQYWYIAGGVTAIGFSSLRFLLTPALEDYGGHISYVIRPQYRRQGHGTRLLCLTLRKAQDRGLDRVLLTTDIGNMASRRVIEDNGGALLEEYLSIATGTMKARYSIDLTA